MQNRRWVGLVLMMANPPGDFALNRTRLFAFALVLLTGAPVLADQAPLISPLATARPVIATHGMVVTQEATASRVGLDILKRGGNAVDAAVAVGFALAVTLPRAGNLGGGGFMLVHRTDLNRTIAIDYRETAPAATTKDVFLDANGEADPFKSRYSGRDRDAGNRRGPRTRLAQVWFGEIHFR
jgi:Gamma-glutamyltranspeptidase